MLENGAVEDGVECVDFTLNGTAIGDVDEGVWRGVENVAGDDDVGSPEVDDAVAVRGGVRHVEHLDAVAVVEHALAVGEISIDRPGTGRSGWILAQRAVHAGRDVLMR